MLPLIAPARVLRAQSALFVLLLAHWLACFWGFVGTAYSSPGSEWLSYDQRITWRHKSNGERK